MQITSTLRTTKASQTKFTKAESEPPQDQEPKDSFLRSNKENIVGLAGLAGITGAGMLTAQAMPSGFDGLTGALIGVVSGAGTGAVAGLGASEGFLRAYPLDPANEKEKYTALTRGLGGVLGAAVGGIVGGVAGYFGAQAWVTAPAAVLGGAAAAGLTNAGIETLTQ